MAVEKYPAVSLANDIEAQAMYVLLRQGVGLESKRTQIYRNVTVIFDISSGEEIIGMEVLF